MPKQGMNCVTDDYFVPFETLVGPGDASPSSARAPMRPLGTARLDQGGTYRKNKIPVRAELWAVVRVRNGAFVPWPVLAKAQALAPAKALASVKSLASAQASMLASVRVSVLMPAMASKLAGAGVGVGYRRRRWSRRRPQAVALVLASMQASIPASVLLGTVTSDLP